MACLVDYLALRFLRAVGLYANALSPLRCSWCASRECRIRSHFAAAVRTLDDRPGTKDSARSERDARKARLDDIDEMRREVRQAVAQHGGGHATLIPAPSEMRAEIPVFEPRLRHSLVCRGG